MLKIGVICFNDQKLDVYGTAKRPCFIAADVAKVIDYSDGNTGEMLNCLEKDEYFKANMVRSGQRRSVWMISELGLYNLLSQSRKPIARMWRRVVHQQLVDRRCHERGILRLRVPVQPVPDRRLSVQHGTDLRRRHPLSLIACHSRPPIRTASTCPAATRPSGPRSPTGRAISSR